MATTIQFRDTKRTIRVELNNITYLVSEQIFGQDYQDRTGFRHQEKIILKYIL